MWEGLPNGNLIFDLDPEIDSGVDYRKASQLSFKGLPLANL